MKMADTNSQLNYSKIYSRFHATQPYEIVGKILSSRGNVFKTKLDHAIIGSNVEFVTDIGERCMGEVVGIEEGHCLVMPFEDLTGFNTRTRIYLKDLTTNIFVGDDLLGRVVDFQGKPIDGKDELDEENEKRSIYGTSINPLARPPICDQLDVGINAINCFMTLGKGQRISIMAGSGVGKSVLMGMIARNTVADVNVIALIGERGREVLEFIESDLGPEGLKRSVVVVATSDASALIRNKAAYTATTIAEYFRDQGKDVILMMDSITRFAMANREISLTKGEPPGQKGYSASVFAKLPKLMERAGRVEGKGTITGIYTVLVEGGDMDEPIADAIKAIADGHIVLKRELAAKNHYPAIDMLDSISRVMPKVVTKEHRIVASYLRDLYGAYLGAEDLINVGAYVKGSNVKVDKAITIYPHLVDLLKQDFDESTNIEDLYDQMVELAKTSESSVGQTEYREENYNQNPAMNIDTL